VNLETATQDQIDNAVVAETIKTDFSNPDYGLASPFMTQLQLHYQFDLVLLFLNSHHYLLHQRLRLYYYLYLHLN
jgi:hypothetical protein